MHYVYFLKSKNQNWVYVGSTKNLTKRVKQHENGEVRSTRSRRPLTLIRYESYSTAKEARLREKKLKKSRSSKEELIQTALSSNG